MNGKEIGIMQECAKDCTCENINAILCKAVLEILNKDM